MWVKLIWSEICAYLLFAGLVFLKISIVYDT